jgi:four helix bundle protein
MQYENTHIYSRALELIRISKEVLDGLPVGYGFIADQLRRASSSILLNFAEGYGKRTKRDSHHYFCIARGSANEVAAILDVANEFGVLKAAHHVRGKDLCDQLARMLSRFGS